MANKYTKTQFNKDIKELTKLINNFKQNGGKSSTEKRTFKIVSVNGKKIPGGEGRYTGDNHSKAAPKACNAACRKRKVKRLRFELMETTRGSDRKIKSYDCERTKKRKPVIVRNKKGKELYRSEYDVKVIEYTK